MGAGSTNANSSAIAVLDDSPAWLAHVGALLARAGHEDIALYRHPTEALAGLRRRPVQVLLLDYVMPEVDGLAVLQALRREPGGDRTAVAMMTGENCLAALKETAFQAGAADVLVKPLHAQELTHKVRTLCRLARPVADSFEPGLASLLAARARASAVEAMRASPGEAVRLIQSVFRLRGDALRQRRLGHFSAAIGHAWGLGVREQDQLLAAAPLMDIGRLALPEQQVRDPSHLGPGDRELAQRHTTLGNELLRQESAPELQLAAEIALSHHEQWNGQGYPWGLAGEDIPLSARIAAVADAFEMMTLVPHPDGLEVERAAAVIEADAGEAFDPAVVAAFRAALPHLRRLHQAMGGRARERAHETAVEQVPMLGP